MEDGLVQLVGMDTNHNLVLVLILVVMEDGLVLDLIRLY